MLIRLKERVRELRVQRGGVNSMNGSHHHPFSGFTISTNIDEMKTFLGEREQKRSLSDLVGERETHEQEMRRGKIIF